MRGSYGDFLAIDTAWELAGGDLRPFLFAYVAGVVLTLTAATSIRPSDGVSLKAIFLAAFSWPVSLPLVVWKAFSAR
jgi:hypothetical protein